MRNFQLLATGVNVIPAMLELKVHEQLWNQYTLRTQTPGTPHREIDDIWLRMNDLTKCAQSDQCVTPFDHRESINYSAMRELPHIRQMIMSLAAQVEAERIGRCLISRMRPGRQIYPHKDIGEDLTKYYDNEPYYSRFHIVLQGLPGSLFHCEDETVNMQTGEVWWFRNDLEHSVVNNSKDDRIHIVCDMRVSK